MFGEDGTDELKSVGVDAFGNAAGDGDGAFDDQGLNFGSHGASTFHDQGKDGTGGALEAALKQEFRRVANFFKAITGHPENTGFIGWAETVFDAPQKPQFVLPVTGQFEDGVDHVFEEFGAGDGAFFGNVADNNDGGIGFLGGSDEQAGAITDLGGRTGGGGIVLGRNGLNRVDDDQFGFETTGVTKNFFKRRGIEKLNVRRVFFGQAGDAGGDLADVFFGTDVEQGRGEADGELGEQG